MGDKRVFHCHAEKVVDSYILASNADEALSAFEDDDFDNNWSNSWDCDCYGVTNNEAELFVDKNGKLRDIENYKEESEDLLLPGKYDVQLPFE